jgi:spermidine synthase
MDTLCLFVIGVISILGQVALLRELQVAFFGVELIYVLALGAWMFWTAGGAILGKHTYYPSASAIHLLFLGLAVLLPLEVVIMRACRLFIIGIPGAYPELAKQLAFIMVSLMPIGLLLGLLFQWSAKRYIDSGCFGGKNTLAAAYAWESLGAVIGGLASTILLMMGVQNFQQILICSVFSGLVILCKGIGASSSEKKKRLDFRVDNLIKMIAAGMVIIFSVVFFFGAYPDLSMTRWNHPGLIISRDTPYSRISITGSGEQVVVYENDTLSYETQTTAAEEFVHLAAIHHESPEKVLILGGGAQGLVEEMLALKPRKIHYIEHDPQMLLLLKQYLPDTFSEAISQDSVNVIFEDPRRYLQNRSGTYDLILIGMPPPHSAQANRFYTADFFKMAAMNLHLKGVLAFRLPSAENVWTPLLIGRNGSIYSALDEAFNQIIVLPGTTNIFLATNGYFVNDPNVLIERFNTRTLKTRLVGPAYIRYIHTNDRFNEIRALLTHTNHPSNTDTNPMCFRFAGIIWLSKFIPEIIHLDVSWRVSWWAFFFMALALVGVLWTTRFNIEFKNSIVAFIAGFIGMVFEALMILHYQVKQGVLFQNIGILFMLFMGGLTAGAAGTRWILTRLTNSGKSRQKIFGACLFIAFSGLNLFFGYVIGTRLMSGLPGIGIGLFFAGMLSAGIFSYASLVGGEDQKFVVSRLYASDLAGGCIGALVGSLFLIPFFGMQATALFLAITCLMGLTLII